MKPKYPFVPKETRFGILFINRDQRTRAILTYNELSDFIQTIEGMGIKWDTPKLREELELMINGDWVLFPDADNFFYIERIQ